MMSVIVVTRNRAEILPRTLQTLLRQESPGDFELIVVDNGSIDATHHAVQQTLADSPFPWSLVAEPTKGLCRARNTGATAAKGEWLLYLDDDALVPSDWITQYQHAAQVTPGCAVMGGPAVLDPALPLPWWWTFELDGLMSCAHYGKVMREYPVHTHPYGLNMAIRRDKLHQYGGFQETLDEYIDSFADETELFIRMRKGGERFLYVPCAEVLHSVLQDRVTLTAIIKRCQRVGQSHALLDTWHEMNFRQSLFGTMARGMKRSLVRRSFAPILCALIQQHSYRLFQRHLKEHAFMRLSKPKSNSPTS